jgi:acyl dehydratase
MQTAQFSLATIREFVGQELGTSGWVKVDQRRIDQFAECTGDNQWIHVDVERAKRESPFGGTIAHGYLSLSMLAQGVFEVLITPAAITRVLNYGFDKVRFLAPVKTGARVRNRLKLLAADDKGDGRTLLTIETTIDIEGQDKPALIAVMLVMAFAD